ncbi:hypothetical protein [Arthrobacter psychrolactophilus]
MVDLDEDDFSWHLVVGQPAQTGEVKVAGTRNITNPSEIKFSC